MVGFSFTGRLELPALGEGFDELWQVRMDGEGGFVVEEWRGDVEGGLERGLER
jgi:hypothetical protein